MKKNLLIVSIMLISLSLMSQSNYLSVNNNISQSNDNIMPVRTLQDSGTDGLIIEYNFPGVITNNINVGEDIYQFVHIGGFGKMHEIGKPALPAHSDFVAIPANANATYNIIDVEFIEYDNFIIHPALKPATDTHGDPEPEFEIDNSLYSTNEYYPENNIEIAETLAYRGNNFIRVRICPVQHNPVTKKIRVISKITYKINFSSSSSFFGNKMLSENLLNIFPNYVLNASSVKKEIEENLLNQTNVADNNRSDFIIITNSRYDEAAGALSVWKQQLGYSVEVVSQSTWTSDEVLSAIHSRYESWYPAPEFFVIIGDHQDVPGVILQSPDDNDFATDLYYACMDGAYDYVPDMAHGRISVSDNEEAIRVVNKIIQYEKNPVSDPLYYQNGLNCAMFQDDENNGYASRRFTHTSENIRDYVMLQGYNSNRVYNTEAHITPTNYNPGYYSNGEPIPPELLRSNGFEWNGGAQEIINNIDEGKFFVFHRDHGYSGGSGWATPYFTTTSMDGLNNGNKLPVVFSINCHTGEFKLNNCFAEKFLRLENGGAVGVFAASYYSYSGYNDGISLGFIDAIWSNPGLIPVFGDGGIPNPNLTPHTDIITMGNVLNQGLIRMMETWDGGNNGNRYTHEIFHYFGDPAMRIFTAFPIQITASNTDTIIFQETTDIEVFDCSVEGALATLVINGELIGSTYIENGSAEFTFNNGAGDFAIVTISKHNYAPYIDTIFIAGKPIPDFSATPEFTCDGIVNFYDHSIINPVTWYWQFGDGETSDIRNPLHDYKESGIYNVTLIVNNSYGSDTLVKDNFITIDRPIAPTTSSGSGCVNSSVLLSASGDGELFWYESPVSNNIINDGENFNTPELTETTTYYVENALPEIAFTGKADSIGEGAYTSVAGLIFDAVSPFNLVAVTMFSVGEGEKEIILFDADNNILNSTVIYLEKGENRVVLDYEIAEGLSYRLLGYTGCELFYNTSSVSFPYEVDGIMSITGSTYIPAPSNKYCFFYNWEIMSFNCISFRVDVSAEIQQNAISEFAYEQNDSLVSFINNSAHADFYFWNFGDGNISDLENPNHIYSADGKYNVTLIIENECGTDTSSAEIEVYSYPGNVNEIPGITSIIVYPNPAKENVIISFDAVDEITTEIQLIDIAGHTLLSKKVIVKSGIHIEKLIISKFNPGVYSVRLKSEKGSVIRKLVIY
ncbi:MAG: PKD domain-containing protein [Bacteroidetes bacterium]|nr:PKD domain-containing protein [Bacteroidota bacterium]MBL6943981.1 PKD domain-containing protein [Bacteroidales bacterium]